MCLAIPSKITKIENEMAVIDVDGVRREASLLLLEDAQVGGRLPMRRRVHPLHHRDGHRQRS